MTETLYRTRASETRTTQGMARARDIPRSILQPEGSSACLVIVSYRDDLQAARARRNALARELGDMDRELERLQTLKSERTKLQRELKQHADEMDRTRAKQSLPLLSVVRIASPCDASWDEMTGDDMVRFCGQCQKNVFDLSAMRAEQAESMLRELGESMCAQFYRRADGTIMTSDCEVGQKKRKKRNLIAALFLSALASFGLGGYLASLVGETVSETTEANAADESPEPETRKVRRGVVVIEDCAHSVLGDC